MKLMVCKIMQKVVLKTEIHSNTVSIKKSQQTIDVKIGIAPNIVLEVCV